MAAATTITQLTWEIAHQKEWQEMVVIFLIEETLFWLVLYCYFMIAHIHIHIHFTDLSVHLSVSLF